MTSTQLKTFRGILEAKRDEITREMARQRERLAVDERGDSVDAVNNFSERELAVKNLERLESQLRRVAAALKRADNGSFGICFGCDAPISGRRLLLMPWSPYCVVCQQQSELAHGLAPAGEFSGSKSGLDSREPVLARV